MADLDKRFDAVVVGSGPTGSIAVKELTERGLDVLLLEAGRNVTEADFVPRAAGPVKAQGIGLMPRLEAGLRGQHVQARRAFFREQTSPFLVNDRENPYSTPKGEYFLWIRGRQLGGRFHSYGRVLQRMSDHDFRGAELDGTGEDWPISYSDVEPWYDHVERFLGVYGNADGIDDLPDGIYCGPGRLNSAETEFAEHVASRWPDRRIVSWRYAAPNPHRVPFGIVAARKTGRLTERTDAVVRRVTVDDRSGRASGVVFVDRVKKTEHRVSADVVVLCASTIESIRLLLLSADGRHPNGLGNSSGLLGRYFMDQCPSLVFGSLPGRYGSEVDDPAPHDAYYPAAGGILISRFVPSDCKLHPRFRGFSFQGALGRMPVPEGQPSAFGLMGFSELLPYRDNSVTLHPKRRDAWGIPIPHIRCAPTDAERGQLREQVRVAREMVESFGARVNFAGSPLGLDSKHVFPDADPISRFMFRRSFAKSLAMGANIHECGGARMGSDAATSVLNEFNQSWDVPNLFVTDASCFVSNGIVGPTLTIMALTARACEFIATQHATGALHAHAST
jgi:choline dehydrogenase-like flavoprotein